MNWFQLCVAVCTRWASFLAVLYILPCIFRICCCSCSFLRKVVVNTFHLRLDAGSVPADSQVYWNAYCLARVRCFWCAAITRKSGIITWLFFINISILNVLCGFKQYTNKPLSSSDLKFRGVGYWPNVWCCSDRYSHVKYNFLNCQYNWQEDQS